MEEIAIAIGTGMLLSMFTIWKRRELITPKNTAGVFLAGAGILIFAVLVSGAYGRQPMLDVLLMDGASRGSRRTVHVAYVFFVVGLCWLAYLGLVRNRKT